jgi:HEAT repeat protein
MMQGPSGVWRWKRGVQLFLMFAAFLALPCCRIRYEADRIRVAGLVERLSHKDWRVRCSAAKALGDMYFRPREAVLPLINCLRQDERGEVRAAAAKALGQIGLYSKEGVPTLIVALEDRDATVRYAAAQALPRLCGLGDESVTLALLKALGDQNAVVRSAAAEGIEDIAYADENVFQALTSRLLDQDAVVRTSAGKAITILLKWRNWHSNMVPGETLSTLIGRLEDSVPSVRLWAARALGVMGVPRVEVVPGRSPRPGHPSPVVRAVAAEALGQAVPSLVRMLVTPSQGFVQRPQGRSGGSE